MVESTVEPPFNQAEVEAHLMQLAKGMYAQTLQEGESSQNTLSVNEHFSYPEIQESENIALVEEKSNISPSLISHPSEGYLMEVIEGINFGETLFNDSFQDISLSEERNSGKEPIRPVDQLLVNSVDAESSSKNLRKEEAQTPTQTVRKKEAYSTHTSFPFSYFDVNTIRKDFPILKETVNGKPLVWFDNAATTQKPSAVIDTVKEYYERVNSNIHRGVHTLSRKASELYEEVRIKVADFIGAGNSENIIFVRGATEGVNLIANAYAKRVLNEGDEILTTQLEHHSNFLPWQELARQSNAKLKVIPIDHDGNIRLDEYSRLLSNKTKIVAITHVANAVGTALPVRTMIDMAHAFGARVVLDAAQSIAHLPVDVNYLDCDFLVFSGHKMCAPTGIGAVFVKDEIMREMVPYQVGGGMIDHVSVQGSTYAKPPYLFEAGTGNLAGVAGLGAAIDYLRTIGMQNIEDYEDMLVGYAFEQMQAIPKLIPIGRPNKRVSVISFLMEGEDPNNIGTALDREGVAVRTGHHCAQPLMQFYNIPGTIRASMSFYNTRDEVDAMVKVLHRISQSRFGL